MIVLQVVSTEMCDFSVSQSAESNSFIIHASHSKYCSTAAGGRRIPGGRGRRGGGEWRVRGGGDRTVLHAGRGGHDGATDSSRAAPGRGPAPALGGRRQSWCGLPVPAARPRPGPAPHRTRGTRPLPLDGAAGGALLPALRRRHPPGGGPVRAGRPRRAGPEVPRPGPARTPARPLQPPPLSRPLGGRGLGTLLCCLWTRPPGTAIATASKQKTSEELLRRCGPSPAGSKSAAPGKLWPCLLLSAPPRPTPPHANATDPASATPPCRRPRLRGRERPGGQGESGAGGPRRPGWPSPGVPAV